MPGTNPTDEQLLALLKAGDRGAFRQLFDRYYKYLLVTVINISGDRELAREVGQEVFFEVWKKREQIAVKGPLKSYLRRAAVNRMLNQLKARRLQYLDDEQMPELSTRPADDPQQQLQADDLQSIIQQAIDALPERCRLVFTLCRLEGLSHKEVAAQLGISTKTVENQMLKALKQLRKAVQPYVSKGLCWLALLLGWWQ
ncbi:MAG: RNA polymerase sigma-70 factor [Bacteroidota bacterium]